MTGPEYLVLRAAAHLCAVMINNAGRSIKLRRFYNAFKHTRATSGSLTTSTQAFPAAPDTDAARSRTGNADLSVQNDSGGKKPRTRIVMERPEDIGLKRAISVSFLLARPLTQNNAGLFARRESLKRREMLAESVIPPVHDTYSDYFHSFRNVA